MDRKILLDSMAISTGISDSVLVQKSIDRQIAFFEGIRYSNLHSEDAVHITPKISTPMDWMAFDSEELVSPGKSAIMLELESLKAVTFPSESPTYILSLLGSVMMERPAIPGKISIIFLLELSSRCKRSSFTSTYSLPSIGLYALP